jgi:mono/diheme cytochrome c family protein
MRWIALPLAVLVASVGCRPDPQAEAEARAAAAAQREDSLMAAATDAFQAAVFDTITWESDQAALDRGQVVYSYSCSICHGLRGLGDAGAVMGADTLRPPSFREPDWRFSGDVEAIRVYVYLGKAGRMPHWGIAEMADGRRLGEKSIDAVARYLAAGMG